MSDERFVSYDDAYMQGIAVAGARLVGVVAAELGNDHQLINRMVIVLGELAAPQS